MTPSCSPVSPAAWRWMGPLLLVTAGLTGCDRGPDAASPGAAQGSASLIWDGQRATVSGEVGSDADKQKLLDAVAKSYGGKANVVDQVKVVKGLGRLGGVALTDPVSSGTDRSQRINTLADALPMVPIQNQVVAATATTSATASDTAAMTASAAASAPSTTAQAATSTAASAVAAAPASVAVSTPPATAATLPPAASGAVAAAQAAAAGVKGAAVDAAKCAQLIVLPVTFASGSARISGQNQTQLRQVAKCIAGPTQVNGHTDDRGSAAANTRLSQARAQAALQMLVKNGAPRNLLSAQGLGASQPAADNSTESGRAKNRRIELKAS